MGIRPQFAGVLVIICLVTAFLVLFSRSKPREAVPLVQHQENSPPSEANSATAPLLPRVPVVPGRVTTMTLPSMSDLTGSADEQLQEFETTRVAELHENAMSDNPESLNVIIPDLTNTDPRIRQAAVDATVQFESTNAIPALKDAYSQTDNPEEKIRIQKAIDFLALTASAK